jgi:hypothetical protein
VPACAEGAIQIIDGKARLISETYCDGLGACLGECPRDAIAIEEREADDFDPQAVEEHLAARRNEPKRNETPASATPPQAPAGGGCPGMLAQMLRAKAAEPPAESEAEAETPTPQLANWPVQLHLAPTQAPYFESARLLIAADCVPFALADFHVRLLAGRTLLIGCPKLDDVQTYRQKLARIFQQNDIRSVDVAFMEVPCCFGLVQIVKLALADSGKPIPLKLVKIGLRGEVIEEVVSGPPEPTAQPAVKQEVEHAIE